MSVTVTVTYTGTNGNALRFAQEMQSSGMVSAIRAEEGNEGYSYFTSMDDPETVMLLAQWKDDAAVQAHRQTPMAAEIALLKTKYALTTTARWLPGAPKRRRLALSEREEYLPVSGIPTGAATDSITPGCLVLEGGGFRGLYTSGALDALMVHGINLQTVIGVSAGALNGANYVSGQIGRSARANLGYRHDHNYIGVRAARKSHALIRLDFLLHDFNAIEPMDMERLASPDRRFVAVVTDCNSGKTLYKERTNTADILTAIKASASLPLVTPSVAVDGVPCLDGGCSNKIPYTWALDEGYSKIVVIKTRGRGFRKEIKEKALINRMYRKNPALVESLNAVDALYNRQCDALEELEKSGRMFVLTPSEHVAVSRIEGNLEKLTHLYWLGYRDMEAALPELKAYLGIL